MGDYSYTSTATCWLDIINPIKSITRINIGNHENDASEGNSQYMSAFGLSKQYYSFNYANAHVLTIATELSYGIGSLQYNFVKADLETAAANPNIKWIIVNYHKVMYTSPNTCSASSCKGSSSLRDTYHPLFDKNRVDLVLQGHVHNYQRTYPLKYDPGSPSSPTRTSTSTSSYTDPEGQIFATVGTGGINFHGLSGKSYFVAKQQAQRFGILDISIADDGSKLTGRHYRNGESSPYDTFTISKPTTISSLKISTANNVNITNQTSPQKIIDQLSSNQTAKNNQTAENREIDASNNRKRIILPDLSQIINNIRSSENTATKADNNQKNNSGDADNENSNLAVKPNIPKEPDKNRTNVRNSLPVANAGRNQIAPEGTEVILDGSRSNDRDGKIESYQWQQASGPKINLDGENKIKPEFVAPPVEHDAILVFRLIVTDEKGGSDSAITAVKINNEQSTPSLPNVPDSSASNSEADLLQLRNVTNSSAR